jgi:hypothetical protein
MDNTPVISAEYRFVGIIRHCGRKAKFIMLNQQITGFILFKKEIL